LLTEDFFAFADPALDGGKCVAFHWRPVNFSPDPFGFFTGLTHVRCHFYLYPPKHTRLAVSPPPSRPFVSPPVGRESFTVFPPFYPCLFFGDYTWILDPTFCAILIEIFLFSVTFTMAPLKEDLMTSPAFKLLIENLNLLRVGARPPLRSRQKCRLPSFCVSPSFSGMLGVSSLPPSRSPNLL